MRISPKIHWYHHHRGLFQNPWAQSAIRNLTKISELCITLDPSVCVCVGGVWRVKCLFPPIFNPSLIIWVLWWGQKSTSRKPFCQINIDHLRPQVCGLWCSGDADAMNSLSNILFPGMLFVFYSISHSHSRQVVSGVGSDLPPDNYLGWEASRYQY